MVTVESIRNASRKSGFDHVNRLGETGYFRGQAYKSEAPHLPTISAANHVWYGPTRKTAEEAAQDYCDWANGQQINPSKSLNSAGHSVRRASLSDDPEVIAALGVLRDARGQRQGRPGYVYCITDGEYLKIGYSTKPMSRIGELQSGNARKLTLLGAIPAPDHTETERALHQKYIKHNVLGEWFEPTSEILSEFGLTDADMPV